MSFNVEATNRFKRQARQLIKKYTSLKNELLELISFLEENPKQGTAIGHDCYKIRIAIASKGKGKSGGARIITHVYVANQTVYLLTIFDKSNQDNISDKELKELLKDLE
jgi:hypothetical protein